ncbi:MAG: ExbD/TolR family protein, partial [Spongiibacter sp.]
ASHQTRVAIHLNAQGQIWVDGSPVADKQLRAALASLKAGQQVKLYADRAVTAATLSTVLSNLPAQNLTLHLLTEADSSSSDTAQQ